jgi:MFS family permease
VERSGASRRRLALGAILGATFMLLVDLLIVQVALPSIERDLNAGFAGLQWVIDAYTLTLAALLLSAGTLADRFSRRGARGAAPGSGGGSDTRAAADRSSRAC